MEIGVGPTYTDFSIKAGTKNIEFPNEFTGAVRPGTFAKLASYPNIKWGKFMTEPIEPRTFDRCQLMLDERYKHSLDASVCESKLHILYVHDSNREYAKDSRDSTDDLHFWRRDRPFEVNEFAGTDWKCTGVGTSTNFSFLGVIYIAFVKYKPFIAVTPAITVIPAAPQVAEPVTCSPSLEALAAAVSVMQADLAEIKAVVLKMAARSD